MKDFSQDYADLFEYCYGSPSPEKRLEVEEKLLNSQAYLMDFLTLRREMEEEELSETPLRPSLSCRAKLRQAVKEEFCQKPRQKKLLWMSSVAAACFVFGLAGFWMNTGNEKEVIVDNQKLIQELQLDKMTVDTPGTLPAEYTYF